MPRQKNETAIQTTPEVVEAQESDVTVEVSENTTNAETTEDTEKLSKSRKPRVTIPKQEIIIVMDCGRSRIKAMPIINGVAYSSIVLDSIVCEVESPPFGEMGAFSMSREKVEVEGKLKDRIEHWVVGRSAKLQGSEWVAMSDDDDNKVRYFPILALGAIASLPNLYQYSTGANEKNRALTIRLVTLSLANPLTLKKAINQCKWMQVDGVKYRLSFSKGALNYPEGYGAALHGRGNKLERPTLFTFDVGYGTACVSEYSNLGLYPKRIAHEPNGGGGVSQLIKEFAKAVANTDSSRVIKPSQLREVLETATIQDGKVSAIAPDGRDIGQALETAIKNWIKDSPLTFALESLGTSARRHPVVLCGGGFAIKPAHHLIKEQMLKQGIPKEHLIETSDPGMIALSELKRLYVTELNTEQNTEHQEEQTNAQQEQAA